MILVQLVPDVLDFAYEIIGKFIGQFVFVIIEW